MPGLQKETAGSKRKRCEAAGDGCKDPEGNTVHHIMELKEHPELALDDENLVSLCTQCHNERHGRHVERKFIPKRRVIAPEQW